jgi:hypothetical protein
VSTPALFTDAARAYARLLARDTSVVGWGTGSVFRDMHPRWPLRLEALLDNDISRWGCRLAGCTIRSPQDLARFDPAHTVVIVYSSSWPAIQAQVAALGPYLCIPATLLVHWPETARRLAEIHALPALPRAPHDRTRAVVVQGPVDHTFAPPVLRRLSQVFPDAALILSTWDDTPEAMLEEVRPFVDHVVTSRRPDVPGTQNRNLQAVSTRAGLEAAQALGARFVLKTRTDLCVDAPGLFALCERLQATWDAGPARSIGLRARIVVPSSFTRQYLLAHPSDLAMWGHVDDLRLYWSAPAEPSSIDLLAPEWRTRTLQHLAEEGQPAESYFGMHFSRALTGRVPQDVSGSWQLLRDLFAVQDNGWWGLWWLKNPAGLECPPEASVRAIVSHRLWERFVLDWRGVLPDATRYPADTTTFGTFLGLDDITA